MLEKYNFIFLIFFQTLYLSFTIDHSLIDSYRPKPTTLIKSYEKILKMSLKSLYSVDEKQNNITAQSIITPKNCTIPFEQFSAVVVNFTRCAVKYARPIHICVECGNVYNDTVSAYNNLKKQDECQEYFSSDQVVIIDIIYKGVTDLWSKNYCENCYQSKCLTQEFFETYKALNNCVISNKSESFHLNATCEKCQDFYANLSSIYSCFIKSPHACMDVVDTMNITFKLWKKYNCIAPFDTQIDYLPVIVAFTICVTPMLFYLLAKNVSIIEDIKIVRPKRKFTTIVAPELTTSEGEYSNVTAHKS